MATHTSVLALRMPWTEELGGLQAIKLQSRTQLKCLSMRALNSQAMLSIIWKKKISCPLNIFELIS